MRRIGHVHWFVEKYVDGKDDDDEEESDFELQIAETSDAAPQYARRPPAPSH